MTVMTSLTVSPDEFAWLWRTLTDLDDLYRPDPLRIYETATTSDEYARQLIGFEQRFPVTETKTLAPIFATLASPDIRLRCYGTLADGREIRTHAAIIEDLAVVLTQQPVLPQHGGPVRLVVTEPGEAPLHLAATMPPAEPGGAGAMLGYTPRVRGEEPPLSWGKAADGRLPTDERIRKLTRLRRSAEGQLIIERGLTTRPHPVQYLSWIDIPPGQFASGRYLIDVVNTETIVTPASADHIAHELRTRAGLGSSAGSQRIGR